MKVELGMNSNIYLGLNYENDKLFKVGKFHKCLH